MPALTLRVDAARVDAAWGRGARGRGETQKISGGGGGGGEGNAVEIGEAEDGAGETLSASVAAYLEAICEIVGGGAGREGWGGVWGWECKVREEIAQVAVDVVVRDTRLKLKKNQQIK
jgi:hypothetical protein